MSIAFRLIKPAELALALGYSPSTVDNWIYKRKPWPIGLPRPIKIGNEWRFHAGQIEEYIAGRFGTQEQNSQHSPTQPPKRRRGRPPKVRTEGDKA